MQYKQKKNTLLKTAATIIFIIYIACLVYFLFLSERYGRNETAEFYRYNLTPFKEIKRFWVYRDIIGIDMVIINLAGNIGAFVPFGFLLPIIYEPFRKWYALLPLSISFSSIIECIQLVTKVGIMDVDDVILNVLGAMIGLLLYSCVHYIGRKLNEKKRQIH